MGVRRWLAVDAPAGWSGVVARTITMTLVGFVVFQVKEWSEAGSAAPVPAACRGVNRPALVIPSSR